MITGALQQCLTQHAIYRSRGASCDKLLGMRGGAWPRSALSMGGTFICFLYEGAAFARCNFDFDRNMFTCFSLEYDLYYLTICKHKTVVFLTLSGRHAEVDPEPS